MQLGYIGCSLLMFLTLIIFQRWPFFHYIRDSMNRSKIKKIRKGQTFFEWLFVTRFRHVISKFYLMEYYSTFILHFLLVVLYIVFWILGIEERSWYQTPFELYYIRFSFIMLHLFLKYCFFAKK